MRYLALLALCACGRVDFDARTDSSGDAASDPLAEGLVAYYPMDELVAGATPDATGHGHTAICAMMQPPAGECPTQVSGHLGGALAFDGATEIMSVASTPDLATTAGFTIAAWIELAQAPASRGCFAAKALGTGYYNSWAACIEPTLAVFFYTVTGTTADSETSLVTISTGTWHHIAVRWDGTTKTISIDGVDAVRDSATTDFDTQPIHFGSDIDNGQFAAPFAGFIDDVRIYNRALGIDELAQLAAR